MAEAFVFYGWQNDLPVKDNRYFIKECINRALRELSTYDLKLVYDESTLNIPGSPEIPTEILKKIDKAAIFIGDLTPITHFNGKAIPNPNVLFEFGYAVKTLSLNNVLYIVNTHDSDNRSFPFDISHKRAIFYNSNDDNAKKRLKSNLRDRIKAIIESSNFAERLRYIEAHANRDYNIIIDVLSVFNFQAFNNFFETISINAMFHEDICTYWEDFKRKIDSPIFILDNKELEKAFKDLRDSLKMFFDGIEDMKWNNNSHYYRIKKLNKGITWVDINNFIEESFNNTDKIAQLIHKYHPTIDFLSSDRKSLEWASQYRCV